MIFVRLRGHRTESLATLAIHLCEAVCIPSLSDELGWSHSQNVGPATKRERDVFESKAFDLLAERALATGTVRGYVTLDQPLPFLLWSDQLKY